MYVITFTHQKGGVGKSTLAWNTVGGLVQAGHRVKVLDLDSQNTMSNLNALRKHYGIEPFNIVAVHNDKELVAHIQKDDHDYLIIDSGGFDSALNRVAIMVSDLNITPVSTEVVEVFGLKKYEQILKELKSATGQNVESHVVLNHVHPFQTRFENIEQYVEESPVFQMYPAIMRAWGDYGKAMNLGRTIWETDSLKVQSDFEPFLSRIYSLNELYLSKGVA